IFASFEYVTNPRSSTAEEPGISVSAAATSPPVQLSATATLRPIAAFCSTTRRARATTSSGSRESLMTGARTAGPLRQRPWRPAEFAKRSFRCPFERNQGCRRLGRDTFTPAREAKPLGSGRFHADSLYPHVQQVG